jgi:hypothetical protein
MMIILSSLIKRVSLDKNLDYILISLIPILTLTFIPIGYEPSEECFNEWAITKLFLDGEGYPKASLSLGYTLYTSILMYSMEFNNFVIVEYFLTFSFLYICLFLLLRYWLSPFLSLLMTISFILILSEIEGHNAVIGLSFVFLYCKQLLTNKFSPFLPLNLILACTFNQAFLLTLIGHYIGTAYNLISNGKYKIYLKNTFYKKEIHFFNTFKTCVILILVVFYSLSLLNTSQRKDNNHFMDEMKWAPTKSSSSSLSLGIMQMHPVDYLARRITIEEAKKQDWYFTNQTLFKNAATPVQAMLLAPEVFVENIAYNLRYLVTVPNSFLLKWHNKPVILVSAIISLITFIVFFLDLYKKKNYVFMTSFMIGLGGLIFVLLLTRTNNFRYNVFMLPFFITFCFQGLYKIREKIFLKKNKNFLINYFVFFMLIGSVLSNINIYNKFHFSNWSSIFLNKDGYRYNFITLKNLIRKNDVLLIKDSKWVKAFFKINHLQVNSMDSLPPFNDDKKLYDLTREITQFWVTPGITSIKTKRQSTNYVMRYNYYFIPLIKYAKEQQWEIIKVNNFATVYRKPNP